VMGLLQAQAEQLKMSCGGRAAAWGAERGRPVVVEGLGVGLLVPMVAGPKPAVTHDTPAVPAVNHGLPAVTAVIHRKRCWVVEHEGDGEGGRGQHLEGARCGVWLRAAARSPAGWYGGLVRRGWCGSLARSHAGWCVGLVWHRVVRLYRAGREGGQVVVVTSCPAGVEEEQKGASKQRAWVA